MTAWRRVGGVRGSHAGERKKLGCAEVVVDPGDIPCRPDVWARLEGCRGGGYARETGLASGCHREGDKGVRAQHEEEQLGVQKDHVVGLAIGGVG